MKILDIYEKGSMTAFEVLYLVALACNNDSIVNFNSPAAQTAAHKFYDLKLIDSAECLTEAGWEVVSDILNTDINRAVPDYPVLDNWKVLPLTLSGGLVRLQGTARDTVRDERRNVIYSKGNQVTIPVRGLVEGSYIQEGSRVKTYAREWLIGSPA